MSAVQNIIVIKKPHGLQALPLSSFPVRGSAAPMFPYLGWSEEYSDGPLFEALLALKIKPPIEEAIEAVREIEKGLFAAAKKTLKSYLRKEIAKRSCLGKLQIIHTDYAELFKTGLLPTRKNISFDQFMCFVVGDSGAIGLAVKNNHQEALELFFSWGLSLDQNTETSNLFWDAVDFGFLNMAKFIYEKIGAAIFKGPDFLIALERSLKVMMDTLEEREGGIEFFRDWLLVEAHLEAYCSNAVLLIKSRILFLNTLIKEECWEFLEEAFMERAYQGFEIWSYSDGSLRKMLEYLSKRKMESWQLHDSEGGGDASISFLDYCILQEFHKLTFYLLAFDEGVPEGFHCSTLFQDKSDCAVKERLAIFASLLSVQDLLLTEEQRLALGMNALEILREEIFEASVTSGNWSALNRLMMAFGRWNKYGSQEILKILDAHPKLRKILIQKMTDLLALRFRSETGELIFINSSVLEFAVQKHYVGLLILILHLGMRGKEGGLVIDPLVFKKAFMLDATQEKPKVFQHLFREDSSLKKYVGLLLNAASRPEGSPRSTPLSDTSSVSVSPGTPEDRACVLPVISPRVSPGVSAVVWPLTQAYMTGGAGGPGVLPVL